MDSFIVKPNEFLAVRHSVLNGNSYDPKKLIEDTLGLEKYTNGRKIIPCFEGDLLQVEETGEVVLTHQNFSSLSKERYQDLKNRSLASPLKEVLDKIAKYKQENENQKVVLCFEPKSITNKITIDETVRLLNEYKIEDAYFDSFFGGKLDEVEKANEKHGTDYFISLHLIGQILGKKVMVTQPKENYDVITVPHTMSTGNVNEPLIYGAVGSTDILEAIAEEPLVMGAYVRLKEGSGIKGAFVKLWNSVTNTEKLRQKHISKYLSI